MKNRLLFLIFLACLGVSCNHQQNSKTDKNEAVRIGWALWSGWYPMAIAAELNLFEKHGVNVEPILYSSYTEIFGDLASGKIDAGYSGLYEILKSEIPDIKVVLITDHSNGAEGLVVSPDIKMAKDLKGKTIGIQGQLSGSEFLITTYLRKNGLSWTDIRAVDVSPEKVLEIISSKTDGVYTWDPYLSQAKAHGYNLIVTTADMPGLIIDVVAFQGKLVKEHPGKIKAFANAWFEAVEFWKNNPDSANALIHKHTGLKLSEITTEGCLLFTRDDNIRAFTDTAGFFSIHQTARIQTEFLQSMGDISLIPHPDSILCGLFIK